MPNNTLRFGAHRSLKTALRSRQHLAWLLLPLCGCGNSDVGTPLGKQPSAPVVQQSEVSVADLETPLSEADIRTIVAVTAELPHGKVPDFSRKTLATPVTIVEPRARVQELRTRYRKAMDAEYQAAEWKADGGLVKAFAAAGVAPAAYASLAIRTSCALAARSARDEVSILRTRRIVQERMDWALRQLDALPTSASDADRAPLFNVLDETVALDEYLNLIERTPQQSVERVAAQQKLLSHLVPAQSAQNLRRFLEERTAMASNPNLFR